ncbi:MAG TPA: cupin domain-containing protein [Candidatus Limnocylindrales bacterium]|nr:cupin domain-containing protein [Candidatus Limnocylindrales bacterium]
MRTRNLVLVAVVGALAIHAVAVNLVVASPASGVSAAVVSRGTYPPFNVSSFPDGGGLFKAQAKSNVDVVVRRHEYQPAGSTGWHRHPYPVLITVIQGTLTFYAYGDKTCTPTVVSAGGGYVDNGRGHIARNETGELAVDVSVIMAPVGAAFRSELDAPGPHCGF